MQSKFFVLMILSALLFAGLASADVQMSVSAPATVSHTAGSFNIVILLNNTDTANAATVNFDASKITFGNATLSSPSALSLPANATNVPTTATVTFPSYQSNSIQGIINISYGSTSKSIPFSTAISSAPALQLSLSSTSINSLAGQSVTATVTNTGNTIINNIALSSSSSNLAFSQSSIGTLLPGQSAQSTITLSSTSSSISTQTVTINASSSSSSVSDTENLEIVGSFCKNGEQGGNLTIDRVDITNDGQGDDTTWYLLDPITVKVRVNNKNEDVRMKNVQVEIGLIDSSGNNVAHDLKFSNDGDYRIDLGDIAKGDSNDGTFEFTVPADFNDGDYKLVVKSYSKSTGESNECTVDNVDDITVQREDNEGKYIAFGNIAVSPSQATCGDTVTLTTDVANVGQDDENQVKVNLNSNQLGVSQSQEIKSGLNIGDQKTLTFTFTVPQNLADKTYTLNLDADYDYRSGNYHLSSDENTPVSLQVFGCAVQQQQAASKNIVTISPSLDSEAQAGKELRVIASIRNIGTNTTNFLISATGYDSWAQLSDISDRVLSLGPGESKDVTITFNVNKDVTGEQSFTIQARAGSSLGSKDVAVNIAKPTGTSVLSGSNTTLLWVIGAVNVILIILIIVVAVRIARR